jgi:hypothetical protein
MANALPLGGAASIRAAASPHLLGRPARQVWIKRRLPWMPKLQGVPEIEGQP